MKKGLIRRGGDRIEKGHYWNPMTGDIIEAEGGRELPGDNDQRFIRMHPLATIVIGPILGLVYAVFLPFIGIAMAATALLGRLLGTESETGMKVAAFNWAPTEAYLSGKRRKKAAPKKEEETAGKEEKKEGPPEA